MIGTVAIVAAVLFFGGAAIEPSNPPLGRTLMFAGAGTAIGGAVGASAGVAAAAGVTTAKAITAGAIIGGTATGAVGAVTAKKVKR